MPSFIYPHLNLQFWAGYFGYYEFINKELGIKFEKQQEWDMLIGLCDLSWIYPFENFCVISEKPIEINMVNGKLHKDGGMSVKYADGFGCYSLNGVAVSEYLATTPKNKLDIDFFKKETNADIKAEFIRKYGIERLLEHGIKIDDYTKYNDKLWSKSKYELWDLKSIFKDITKHEHCYFLKMLNLSTQSWHVEGVHPDCNTLEKALSWRMNNKHTELLEIK